MNFYRCIFVIIFIYFRDINTEGNPDLSFPKAGLEKPNPDSIGFIFFIEINNTSDKDYDAEIAPDECCLNDVRGFDCEFVNILGGCSETIPKGLARTLRIVAPLLDIYERRGYCTVYVDSKAKNGPNKRNTVKINFDTTINNDFSYPENFKHCQYKDEDPFNECNPVNCDSYYNGKKPYYSRKYKRCVKVPSCISDDNIDYPTVAYNPVTNQCFKESLNEKDLATVKSFKKHSGRNRKAKDVLIISRFQPNYTEFANNIELIDNIPRSTTIKLPHLIKPQIITIQEQTVKSNCLKSFWKKYFIDNRWALLILSSVITVQCFLICTILYCLSKTCSCCEEKKIVHKFFNYRQDASVTTPLIGTSNVDTETDYQYMSESSNNAEQKIKCYKACQKDNQNIKMSMSDDILSKCLNRRDWKKFKSEAITEVNKDNQGENNIDNIKDTKYQETDNNRKVSETRVVFEDEIKNFDKSKSKAVSIISNVEEFDESSDIDTNQSSEKEIKCHSYNCFDDISGFRPTKNTGCYKAERSKKGTSISTEKGAQAYFSNDSIDDFLSERGVTYLAGENISKYTFSTELNDVKPISSTVSNKTSKNFVKNVLSLLHKRSKPGPSSDPGKNDDIDVKLIHMSKASVYTSSNDSDYIRTLKRKDSRTSF